MAKHWLFLTLATLASLSNLEAQQSPAFRFRPGEMLQYRVEQRTKVVQTLDGETSTFEATTELTKRWDVLEVRGDGSFVLQLTIPQLKLVQKLPNGQTLSYDSAKPEEAHPALKQQMEQFLGKPTVKLHVDARGRVVHAQPLLNVPVGHFANEPPFAIILPEEAWQPQIRWVRPYSLALEPPLGTGEKYDLEQQFELRSLNQQQAEITWVTHVKNPPVTPSEKIPLLQKISRGVALFDLANHRVSLVRTQAGGTVEDHEGPGSKYEFSSEYIERLIP